MDNKSLFLPLDTNKIGVKYDVSSCDFMRRRVALVTGAGSGIGRAIATTLARTSFCDLVLNDLPPGEETVAGGLRETQAQCEALGAKVLRVEADVTNRDAVRDICKRAVSDMGGLHIAVSNAYYAERADFLDLTLDAFQRTLDVTLVGSFNVCQMAAREMSQQHSLDKIVLITSVMADYPYLIDTNAPYNAAKAALNNMSESMASSLSKHRINVNCVSPGWIATQGERKFTPDWDAVDANARSSLPRGIGDAQDIANAVRFLCSEQADYITGTNLKVDGGFGISQRVPGLHDPVKVPT